MKRFTTPGKLGSLLVALIAAIGLGIFSPVQAVTPPPTTITVQQTPPPSAAPDLILTSVVGSALLDYAELYNQGDTPFHLAGWTLQFTIHDATAGGCSDKTTAVNLPDAWLLPKKYLTMQRASAPVPGSLAVPFTLDDSSFLSSCLVPKLATTAVIDNTGATEQIITLPAATWSGSATTAAQHKQRNNSPSSTRIITGIFDTDYKIVTGNVAINSDPLYNPPADVAGLQIVEILPNARNCAPSDLDPTCDDYVKFYNPTDQAINLASYRVRIGYKGQSESVTNTFTWGAEIDPLATELLLPAHTYFMLTTRNDGQPLSITDTGNYVWLEDAYGTTKYDPIIQYPDASSTTKIGQAWAYDGSVWQWTAAPQPNAPNYFPPVATVPNSDTTTGITVGSILKPCAEDQYRNPATNRCRSVVATTSTLVPCGPGQERNPETNRCRSVATITGTLAPCPAGSERNPDTNRCRKVATVAGAETTAVKDVVVPSTNNTGWFVAALAIALALSYGIYEWRQELGLNARKLARALLDTPKRWRR